MASKKSYTLLLLSVSLGFSCACFGLTWIGMLVQANCLQWFVFGIPAGMAVALPMLFLQKRLWVLFAGWVVLVLLGWGMMRIFFFCDPDHVRMTECAARMKSLGVLLAYYADENDGWLPPARGADGFDFLRSAGYLTDDSGLICPFSATFPPHSEKEGKFPCDYVYYGGGKYSEYPSDRVLVMEKHGKHPDESFHILYSDWTLKRGVIISEKLKKSLNLSLKKEWGWVILRICCVPDGARLMEKRGWPG